jgi:alpha-beta hydrolase superfamily lysophospholipase
VVYLPDGEPKGLLHIVHGMTEHIGRYDKFMSEMAEQGYICFGYDNLGHGYTADEKGDFGYIAKKGGHDLLAKDVKVFSDVVKSQYGVSGKALPYYLMGHSMGSFITRYAVTKYVKPDKYIIMGTGGKNSASGLGLAVIAMIKLFRGGGHVSPFVDKLAFGSYNKRFGGGKADDSSPWLTNDKAEREKYYADRFCTFKFTLSAMGDLIRLNKITNTNKWYKGVPKNLPILIVSGDNDPVGNYGKGILFVAEKLKKNGKNVKHNLYKGARHEILNDFTYDDVKNDIIKFIEE